MPKNKSTKTAKTDIGESTHSTIAKFLFVLYLLTGFIPLLGAMDYDAPEWLYVSVVNIISLVFIYINKDNFQAFVFPKHVKIYFLLFTGFFVISCFSIVVAVNVHESLVHLSRLLTVMAALYCLYVIIKKDPTSYFNLLSKISIIIVIYFSWKAIMYFMGNRTSPRTYEFLKAFPHNFSNINIYAAYLVVQFPFVVYGFIHFKKIWKYLAAIAIFISLLALFFASARTALLSLLIMLLVFIAFLIFGIIKRKIPIKREVILLTLLPVFSILLVLNINRLDKNQMNTINEILVSRDADFQKGRNSITNGTAGIDKLVPKDLKITASKEVGSVRFSLWELAFLRFKENPVLGIGYGNYKATGKKEFYLKNAHRKGLFINPRRVHNDFLEKLVETGVFGFLLYVSLFIFPLILFIIMFRREKKFEKQLMLVAIFTSAIAYTLDALLNFPLERPPVQLYFIFVVIFILLFFKKEDKITNTISGSKLNMIFFGIFFFTSLASFASNYLVFKSYQFQRTMREDLEGKTLFSDQKLKYSYNYIKEQWVNYPQLSYVGTVNNVYLANYAIKAKKYKDALEILNKSQNYNTDAILVKSFKAEIYLNVYDNLDSAKHYSKLIFDSYPGFKTNYRLLKSIYAKEKDSVSLFKIMNYYTKLNKEDVNEWEIKANTLYDYTKNSDLMLKVLDTGLVYNTNSNILLLAKKKVLEKLKFKSYLTKKEVKAKHQIAYNFFVKGQYAEAKKVFEEIIKNNPADYLSIQNIGIIHLINKDYENGVEMLSQVIDAHAFSDGKAEYSRGYCYEQLGDMEKAKIDYKNSRRKKYSQAMTLPESKYK